MSNMSPSPDDGNISYVLIKDQIEKMPFNEDFQEGLPDYYFKVYSESTEVDFCPERDIIFETEDDLVRKYYEKQGKSCPLPVQTFLELYGQTLTGVDGEPIPISELVLYYSYYGIEMENLYFIRKMPMVVAICDTEEQCRKLAQGCDRILPISKGKLYTEGIYSFAL